MKHIKFIARENEKLFRGAGGYEVIILEQTHVSHLFGNPQSLYDYTFNSSEQYTLISGTTIPPSRYDSNYAYVRNTRAEDNLKVIVLKRAEYPKFKKAVEEYNELYKEG